MNLQVVEKIRELVKQGCRNQDIANQLDLSYSNVSWYISKLGISRGLKGLTREQIYGREKSLSMEIKRKVTRKANYIPPKMSTRICECTCKETFTCRESSKQRFKTGHQNKNRKCNWSGERKEDNKKMLQKRWKEQENPFKKIKGKTLEEIYGVDKAKEIISKKMKTMTHQYSSNYKNGYFFSTKNNKQIFYRSSYELQAFQLLEQMSKVLSYEYEALIIPYDFYEKLCFYVPDILITYTDGTKELIEIKPTGFTTKTIFLAKMEGLKKYCQENSILSSVWTEKELFPILQE